MAATKLQLNVSNFEVGSTPLTKITSVAPDPGGTLLKFKADNDRYPTVIANADNEPTLSVTTGDIGTMQGFATGSVAVITFTMLDATGQTGGAINWTLANAVFRTHSPSQGHAQFGTTTGHWDMFSSDGQTSPISFTRS